MADDNGSGRSLCAMHSSDLKDSHTPSIDFGTEEQYIRAVVFRAARTVNRHDKGSGRSLCTVQFPSLGNGRSPCSASPSPWSLASSTPSNCVASISDRLQEEPASPPTAINDDNLSGRTPCMPQRTPCMLRLPSMSSIASSDGDTATSEYSEGMPSTAFNDYDGAGRTPCMMHLPQLKCISASDSETSIYQHLRKDDDVLYTVDQHFQRTGRILTMRRLPSLSSIACSDSATSISDDSQFEQDLLPSTSDDYNEDGQTPCMMQSPSLKKMSEQDSEIGIPDHSQEEEGCWELLLSDASAEGCDQKEQQPAKLSTPVPPKELDERVQAFKQFRKRRLLRQSGGQIPTQCDADSFSATMKLALALLSHNE